METASAREQRGDLRGWLAGLAVIAVIVVIMMAFWFMYHP